MINTNILIIDDEEIVRDGVRDILIPEKIESSGLEEASSFLFDDVIKTRPISIKSGTLPEFKLDEANNGKTGLEKVKQALAKDNPYAVIFLDMRMPGWDGLKTAQEIRLIDPKVQLYFITAFSDKSIEQIINEVGGDVGYLNKPFSPDEITQIAVKGIHDWSRLSILEKLLNNIAHIGLGSSQLNTLLVNIFHQITDYIGTEYALLCNYEDRKNIEEIASIGLMQYHIDLDQIIERINNTKIDAVDFYQGTLICPMEQYCIVAIPSEKNKFNQEKIYLLKLFVENAVNAIKNAKIRDKFVQNEKLSAVGQAIAFVMHDIRNPISQIQSLTDLLINGAFEQDEQNDLLKLISESSNNAMDIVEDVRDFVTRGTIIMEKVELNSLIQNIIDRLDQTFDMTNVEAILVAETTISTEVDEKKLKRVFTNIFYNAMQAFLKAKVSNPKLIISLSKFNNKISIKIQDNGPGIPSKIRTTLFEPFVTSGKIGGSGLGLAIVKQIIKDHNGSINVSSSDEGSSFNITLPLI